PRLAERRRQSAGTLSGGEQRMLSLARVFADPPRLLVVDELSLGLAPAIVDSVFDALAEIRERGTTLVVIEQHVDRALTLADHVVLLTQGRVVYRGLAAEIGDQVERLLPGEPA
ncbi:MAG: ATP-binding cassette domain-containing protein, partial [Acidimicrobiia bacterium]|nr:ATP-binding cassette domain-containing protein [Acidimicrobiia bacterium]